jgi:DeoR family suf operon transcriptional repressor
MTLRSASSTKEEILRHLLKEGQGSAIAMAEELGISAQAMRKHLKDLEREGLIEHQREKHTLGRPQFLYQLSKQGREQFPQRYGEFALSFINSLVETVGEEQLGEVFKKQWQRKAEVYRRHIGLGSLAKRVDKLVELRRQEGYMAELHPLSPDGSEKFILSEHHCAIADVAESYPTVCGHELEMFAAILPDCAIERTHWLNNGEHNCGYLIQPK